MKKIRLDKNWILQGESVQPVEALVPGCVHTDLAANGLIKDIFWRDNNRSLQWIEECDWTYSCTFDAELGENVYLVFEGLDTYTEIYLNGAFLGKTDNMFIPHKFAVSDFLKEKNNYLKVRFLSPIKMVADKPELRGSFTRERMHSRRIQCTYGWDWVDRFVTCGIYRPVYLTYSKGIELDSVYVYTENIDQYSAQICTEYEFSNYALGGMVSVDIFSPNGTVVAHTAFYADQPKMVRRFDIADPMLWYPNGYGDQHLYRLVVSVDGDCHEENFGIRMLKVVQLQDQPESDYWKQAQEAQSTDIGRIYSSNETFSGFFVVVNGIRIFCKGGNWVPCEPFPSAETTEKIECLVKRAKDMGANFLRVWGGGLFEQKALYDACDQAGLLVAQDFLMACGRYPEQEDWFISALQQESLFAVKFLRNHPCLAWWHGDNENALRGSDTLEDYIGRDSALRGIAPQIYSYDYSRQFLPSTPYGGNTYASMTCGTAHNTNYVGQMFEYFRKSDCSDYKEYLEQFTARFISEEPAFGAICRPSMLRFMTEADLIDDETEEMLLYHTKGNPDLEHHFYYDIRDFAKKIFGEFKNGEDRYFKYKYLQFEWVRVVFENARNNLGYCNGLIFWMHNDCWPAALGWSFIDYYTLPKASYYSFKRCAKPMIASIKASNTGYAVTVSNDTNSAINFAATISLLDLERKGSVVHTVPYRGMVSGYGTTTFQIPMKWNSNYLAVCDIKSDNGEDRCFYKQGNLLLQEIDNGIQILERGEDFIVLQANQYLHAIELEGQFVFDDNYFSMLSGETRRVHFEAFENERGEVFTIKAYTVLTEKNSEKEN